MPYFMDDVKSSLPSRHPFTFDRGNYITNFSANLNLELLEGF